ncbi:hypothetical protein Vretifemale_614, partial [Volvox reticuliferus]
SPPPPSPPPPPPPSPRPPPPPSPPPPSPPPQCTVCTSLSLDASPIVIFPITLTKDQCDDFSSIIIADTTDRATAVGAVIIGVPAVTCEDTKITVCTTFLSAADAQKMGQDWVDEKTKELLAYVVPSACPAYLDGYTVSVTVDDSTGVGGCLSSAAAVSCQLGPVPFPKCECDTSRLSTPFVVSPTMYRLPGRTKNTNLFCFTLDVRTPNNKGYCGKTTSLLKGEVWGNEDLRRQIEGIGVQPAGADKLSFRSPSWGPVGDQTLKVTPLNWSLAQAKNATICLELTKGTDLGDFCNFGMNTCWINLFDPNIKCCPLFAATLV